ncbi:MAG: TerC family protein [Phycisphaeraceae bacterium]|nr:TerC family protein [Phycisphaerales bacterium]QOJ17505.1 MAG: TerC family protein [Phycisphaeraceae bacterium]
MEHLLTLENLAALLTLAGLEIVLGIDNIVFISILAAKLPPERQQRARTIGLLLAMVMRIALLLAITWVMGLTRTLFTLPFFSPGEATEISGRDLILIVGGAFLIAKATHEIHDKLEGSHETLHQPKASARFPSVIAQIIMMDLIFSLDSVITAVGMVKAPKGESLFGPIAIMVTAIVISIVVMLLFAGAIGRFIERHPTTKMLALSFLLMIGVMLAADGFGQHIPKGYIYSAMAFSLFVELLNLRVKKLQERRGS